MMEEIRSKINPILSLDFILNAPEDKMFDRKSCLVSVPALARLISAFANASGGTIVIGINEKTKEIEGINGLGTDKINDLIAAPNDCCRPMPQYVEEFLPVTDRNGKPNRLLLLHIDTSTDQVIRTSNDSTFLRIGDRTKEVKGEDLRNLEYSKSVRHFEDELSYDARIEDLDKDLLNHYKSILGAEDITDEQLLKARGFIRERDNQQYLTNAAVLLFAKNIPQFYPNCRIRFIRYDGTKAKTGTDINIIRDNSIELPLLRIIEKTKEFISTQLREFTALNIQTGRFQIVPEYPEFAWLEGIVNAVTHREYAMSGQYIKVSMYDDRLEIESPGRLPNIVTINNIKETRYSRNPRISRVLSDFGWVRELNEGVKRIYSDMEKFFLEEPEYSEPGQSVKLVLRNNILMRNLRKTDRTVESVGEDLWNSLDETEHLILVFMSEKKAVTRLEIQNYLNRSNAFVSMHLSRLIDMGVVRPNGKKYDPKRTYSIVYKR